MAEVLQPAVLQPREGRKPRPIGRIASVLAANIVVLLIVFATGVLFADPMRAALADTSLPVAEAALSESLGDFDSALPYSILGIIAMLLFLGTYNLVRLMRTSVLVRSGMEDVLAGDYTKRIPVRGGTFERSVYSDFNLMVKTFRKKIAIQKYVSDSTNKMIDDLRTGEYTKDAVRREITVLFSDIRGFTTYAERHDPMNVVDTLNTLFDIQVDAIVRHGGDIDKFIGDEVMATFADPGDAFKAAMEIQKKVAAFNRGRKKPLHVGIGIHTGEAVIGALGSGDFYNWTAIGNSVNIGRRLCTAAAAGEVLISEQAFAAVRTTRSHEQKAVSAKGISTPLAVRSFSV